MVFRCLPNKHICSASYLIFRRGVLLPLLKHSHTNSHDLVGLPISQRKFLSWILVSRPWVSCLGPKPQSGGIQRWVSVSAVISFRWLAAAEPFFNGTVCFFPCGTPNILKAVWHLLGRDSHPAHPSTLLFHFGTGILCFPV